MLSLISDHKVGEYVFGVWLCVWDERDGGGTGIWGDGKSILRAAQVRDM